MAEKVWPQSLIGRAKSTVFKVLGLEVRPDNEFSCKNCGGSGRMYAFIASTNHPSRQPRGMEVSKHIPGMGWFTGETVSEECPVCHGME